MKFLFSDKMDMICGGRHLQYYEKTKAILDKFKSCNANLVFFHPGYKFNEEKQIKAKNESYTQTIKTFDEIYSGVEIISLANPSRESTKNWVPIINSYESGIVKLLQNYGQIRYVIHNLCDLQLAKFAFNNNALAVVGDDSDYLIYRGKWKYWSSKDFNIDEFQTMEFNRKALLKHFRIKPHHLSLFATCSGNSFCDYSHIQQFHSRLGNLKNFQKFKHIVRYVRQYEFPNNLSSDELKKLTNDLYGEFKKEYLHDIKASLDSYDYNVS